MCPALSEPAGVQRRIIADIVRHDRRVLPGGVLQLRVVVHSDDIRLVRCDDLKAMLAKCGRECRGRADEPSDQEGARTSEPVIAVHGWIVPVKLLTFTATSEHV